MLTRMALVEMLADRIASICEWTARPLVAIDGPDAAGKTTLADQLAQQLGSSAIRASIDHFEHPSAVRVRHGRTGDTYYRDAFDHKTFRCVLLAPFAGGAKHVTTEWRDPLSDDRREVIVDVPARAVLIADGVFMQRPELRDLWSLVIYLSVSPETSMARAKVRDLAWNGSAREIERGYRMRYLPGQEIYRSAVDPESLADILVDNTDPTAPVVIRGF